MTDTSENAGVGHNSGVVDPVQLRSFIERIRNLNEEKKRVAEDIKEVYAEAKSNGFDTKIMRKVIALLDMDPAVRAETEALIECYLFAAKDEG